MIKWNKKWSISKVEEVVNRVKVGYVGSCQKDYCDKLDGVPMIRTTNLTDDGLCFADLKYISRDFHLKNIKSQLKKNDILIARHGENGRAYIFEEDIEANCLNVVVIEPNDKKMLPHFLKYIFDYDGVKKEIQGLTVGSVQNVINTKTIAKLEIGVPTIKDQEKILEILLNIDKKIECNKKINDNLLQQAQAIYCDMFITKANDSWQLGHLSNLITVRYGKDHKKLADGIYPVYGSGGIMRYVEKPLYEKESVLIPRKGTLNNVMYVNEPFWSVDTMFFTEMKQSNIAKFVFHFVKSKDLASLNSGSAVPSMTTDILNAMELRIPDTDTLAKFESTVSPMYQKMHLNIQESAKLAELRDSILPKLMSGEVDVADLKF